MQRLSTYLNFNSKNAYVVNLDPAVSNLPYVPNIDIRDTVDYKGVMKEQTSDVDSDFTSSFNLGPNGSIMTSLNLFATRFDQVLDFLQKRSTDNEQDSSFSNLMIQFDFSRYTGTNRSVYMVGKWDDHYRGIIIHSSNSSYLCD